MPTDWARYWRSAGQPIEAMYAHFERHVYHRHSHETYSFGVTEEGAQTFRCRGGMHTSAAGMTMAFNPDDPHDGHAADERGFTYRMLHLSPKLVTDVLADRTEQRAAAPLFAAPVVHAEALATRLRTLHRALTVGATPLRTDELLSGTIDALLGVASMSSPRPAPFPTRRDAARIAAQARAVLEDAYGSTVRPDDLASAAGRSRFVVYRAFREAYGLAPSEYERQLRLRTARRMLAAGVPIADVANAAGFADQSHLTRWFVRTFGVTPGAYRAAALPALSRC